jgi:hypothetical protein
MPIIFLQLIKMIKPSLMKTIKFSAKIKTKIKIIRTGSCSFFCFFLRENKNYLANNNIIYML